MTAARPTTPARLWRQPSAILLLVQLGAVLVYPFLDESPLGRGLVATLGLVVLVLAIRTVRATPVLAWVSVLLGLPIVVLTLLEAADPSNGAVALTSGVLHAAFYFYASFALIRYMFNDRFITSDELWATGATFTVVAWAFAYTFVSVQVAWPGSFTAAVDPEGPRTWFELLFLSFTNLTSVGLSDITPILAQARSVVMIEQVAGLMYVAFVISRVVALTVTRQRDVARLTGVSKRRVAPSGPVRPDPGHGGEDEGQHGEQATGGQP
jgi:Ion channel